MARTPPEKCSLPAAPSAGRGWAFVLVLAEGADPAQPEGWRITVTADPAAPHGGRPAAVLAALADLAQRCGGPVVALEHAGTPGRLSVRRIDWLSRLPPGSLRSLG